MSRSSVTSGRVGDHRSLILENDRVRAVILPDLGGRIWTLEDRARERQWIWHRPDVPLAASPLGAPYDDVWAGGWEELFPNDAAGVFEGRELPDHGEWWTMKWRDESTHTDDGAAVSLTAATTVLRAECTKEFSLADDGAVLRARYTIRSLEADPFHFLFKQHLPVRISPDCRLLLPGGSVEAVDPAFGTIVRQVEPLRWPHVPGAGHHSADLRDIPPPDSGAREFVYVRDLPAPWCGVYDRASGASLRMVFDQQQLPYVWLFLSYGGWRDVYTAVLEPCTNLPKDLARAVELRQAARLAPGQTFVTEVTVELGGDTEPAL